MVQSVVDICENEWCRWLFDQPFFTEKLCQTLKISRTACVYFGIPTTHLATSARGPGDIDILLADPGRPEESTAIEVKRIKISEPTFATLAPTKLVQSSTKGVTQANLLGQIGFQRTWLLVIVATDGRARPGVNFFSRGITWDLQDRICAAPVLQKGSRRSLQQILSLRCLLSYSTSREQPLIHSIEKPRNLLHGAM